MAGGTYRETLSRPGMQPFLWAQFLGAFNDNVCKIVLSLLAVATAATPGASGGLTAIGVVFVIPFLLFSGYAGELADRLSKRAIIVWLKAFEVAVMAFGIVAFWSGRFDLMLGVLFLMAAHSAFFSPAKYGIVPELVEDGALSRANGLLEMSTFAAIVLGTAAASYMFAAWKDRLALVAVVLTLLAVAGFLASLRIPSTDAPRDRSRVRFSPWGEILKGFGSLRRDRSLLLAVAGISYFWFLGATLQMLILLFGEHTMGLSEALVGSLGVALAVGIAIGSLAAGRLSGDKVELGLVPLGSIGMGVCAVVLPSLASSLWLVAACLGALGFSAGLFIVPLNALLQHRPAAHEKGRLIATNNFLNTIGILLASGVVWLLGDWLGLPPERVILVCGLAILGGTIYVLALLPHCLVRFGLWLLTHSVYRIRIVGAEHVPQRGPALLVCNHVSHVDGFLVGACIQRFVRFLVYRPYYEHWLFNPLLRMMHAIPAAGGGRDQALETIARARTELERGHVVCIFAEGGISRTGNLLPFKRGLERMVEGLDVPVVPVYLDRVWGSIFSFKRGRFFWKRPERLPYPVTVAFGPAIRSGAVTAAEVRQALVTLGAEAFPHRFDADDGLPHRFVRTARRQWGAFCMADSTGRTLTYGKTLVAASFLSRTFRALPADESMVGLMLPSSVGGSLANIAVSLAGRVPVNLNFTAGPEALAAAIDQCRIRTIVTSRVFLAKAKIEARPEMVFVEDLLAPLAARGVGATLKKVVAAAAARLLPKRVLVGGPQHRVDEVATIIFSSGSTGRPKGVMLTHRNILSNVEGMAQTFAVSREDRLLGVLPFFHSFGFTGGLWLPIIQGFGVVYHPNPMDAGTIGELVQTHSVTMMISTPTFCAAYARKITKEQFASLRIAVVGAERLREPVAHAFTERYGLDLLEGYGCTEMAPVISVNLPDVPGVTQRGRKPGTVGHPLPGVAVRAVDPDTGETLPPGAEGLLLVKGPNRMLGYLHNEEATRAALRDGWYVTGDIGSLDDDGFVRITDRLARFSKIAGEMVPHLRIEEAISTILDDQGCVVVAVPDDAKGERLVAFYSRADVEPADLWRQLGATDLPKLWIPRREHLHRIDAIPLLGTGKVDLRGLKQRALELDAALAAQE